MTTSKNRSIVSLCFETDEDFEKNLDRLITLIDQSPEDAIIVAPEVALSGFAYDRFDEAAAFTVAALEKLRKCVPNRLLIFTAITKEGNNFYNVAYMLHNDCILHRQAKAKLFALGAEHEHFTAGEEGAITPFVFEGITIGILICFELRFKTLWQRMEGCDIIALPAQWGKLRADHFTTLTNALALMNQCYVIASDAANEDTSAMSGIITPFGGEIRNSGAELLTSHFEERTVLSMRRYLNVGIE
ncbi:carbon-nitrogen hydrolase family protein [Sulfuricurvum sp.]|uniref:carbon-nitrogen hydrolase family protein n=1 Tax=Sulfuricurvum sp. TaxID=2025608 RepID=UPI002622D28E|nr:carbon-nitrogen hydrolase family protein [Sulfuricurvum sp.]MDD2267592.1 carbon-nitrogen hydrolase family protein [Sulfuricurvum sp.]MDD2784756.1 carbon-nitrogen hydrolase family protein [Sulfuricurvum sp.]